MKENCNLFLLIILFSMLSSGAYSQTVMINVERDPEDTLEMTVGPNTSNFLHLYIGLGVIQPTGNKKFTEIKIFSPDIFTGIRYKHKFSNIFSGGLEIEFRSLQLNLSNRINLISPFSPLSEKQNFQFHLLGGGPYLRINFEKERGNVMGGFMDLSGHIYYTTGQRHFSQYQNSSEELVKVSTRKISLFNSVNFESRLRLGYNRYSIFAGAFLASPVNSTFTWLPENYFFAGIELGLHR